MGHSILNTTLIDYYHVQNAFSIRLSEHGFNFYPMLVVDLLYEFELGVWKAVLTHLIWILYANKGKGKGKDRIQRFNKR